MPENKLTSRYVAENISTEKMLIDFTHVLNKLAIQHVMNGKENADGSL